MQPIKIGFTCMPVQDCSDLCRTCHAARCGACRGVRSLAVPVETR